MTSQVSIDINIRPPRPTVDVLGSDYKPLSYTPLKELVGETEYVCDITVKIDRPSVEQLALMGCIADILRKLYETSRYKEVAPWHPNQIPAMPPEAKE